MWIVAAPGTWDACGTTTLVVGDTELPLLHGAAVTNNVLRAFSLGLFSVTTSSPPACNLGPPMACLRTPEDVSLEALPPDWSTVTVASLQLSFTLPCASTSFLKVALPWNSAVLRAWNRWP
jgi:hypothetical protein